MLRILGGPKIIFSMYCFFYQCLAQLGRPNCHKNVHYIITLIVMNIFLLDFRYELLFGVTTADATFALNNRQLEYGLEPEERNRILSDFVSSNYGLHQREIFAAIVNEYTDWQSVAQHPVNIRDNTLEALTDANYVAPIVETGDYHSSLNARSWFYVFDYQTKNSYYKQVSL